MIVNKKILQIVNTCDESLTHFITILGKGDESFEMSLEDALIYLNDLATKDEQYIPWVWFIENLKNDATYLKLFPEEISFGKYCIGSDKNKGFETLESAILERNLNYEQKLSAELSHYSEQLYIAATVKTENGETTVHVDEPVLDATYLVFDPILGQHYSISDFTVAKAKLEEVRKNILDRVELDKVGRQIIVNGEVVAFDVIPNV